MNLIEHFINERVLIITNTKQVVTLRDGGMVEVPLSYQGMILEFDDEWILFLQEDATETLIQRPIAAVERMNEVEAEHPAFKNLQKPDRDGMN